MLGLSYFHIGLSMIIFQNIVQLERFEEFQTMWLMLGEISLRILIFGCCFGFIMKTNPYKKIPNNMLISYRLVKMLVLPKPSKPSLLQLT